MKDSCKTCKLRKKCEQIATEQKFCKWIVWNKKEDVSYFNSLCGIKDKSVTDFELHKTKIPLCIKCGRPIKIIKYS